tara:strand:+ start:331 stop:1758 length:1428 start_codon:yes stop_codon:yes gene_type:complete
MHNVFSPESVGCGSNASAWSSSRCPHRFLLTPLGVSADGHVKRVKETFYFGGSQYRTPYRDDLATLIGPDQRQGPLGAEPPLWLWEETRAPPQAGRLTRDERSKRHQQKLLREQAEKAERAKRVQRLCKPPADAQLAECSVPPKGGPRVCHHRGCEVCGGNASQPKFCVRLATPWLRQNEANLVLADFTPNYLCDARAMLRIRASAADPSGLQFVLLMRDPIMRAFSEWSMMSLGFFWDEATDFGAAALRQVHQLRSCDEILFEDPSLVLKLPINKLASYLRRCFGRGGMRNYITSSLYAPCIAHALRLGFKREQFLVLRYEDLTSMDPAELLDLLQRFTGLRSAPDAAARRVCNRRGGSKPKAYSSYSPDAPEILAAAAKQLERFFAPWNALLRELVDPHFGWERRDHTRAPLNATERQRIEEAQAARVKKHHDFERNECEKKPWRPCQLQGFRAAAKSSSGALGGQRQRARRH